MGRVLVVDDEPDVLLLCRLNLQQRGHELVEASEGARGLELAREERLGQERRGAQPVAAFSIRAEGLGGEHQDRDA